MRLYCKRRKKPHEFSHWIDKLQSRSHGGWYACIDSVPFCILILGIFEEEGKKTLEISVMAGQNVKQLLPWGMDDIKAIARGSDCTHIRFEGRPGWRKFFNDFRVVSVELEAKVEP